MDKVLIFTAATGGGHNEAASSLEGEFTKRGYKVKKVDILKEINKVSETIFMDFYKILINKFPNFYGSIYEISNNEIINKFVTKSFTKIAAQKIYHTILQEDPDLIIGTHAFVVSVIGHLKDNKMINIPFISVVTDYEAHYIYINSNVDAYITGSAYTNKTLERRGMSRDKIYSYGIPIKREFFKDSRNEQIKKENFQVLLMAGSLGLKNMKTVLQNIVSLERNFHIVVVCGNNNQLRNSIENHYLDLINAGRIELYGFTNEIPYLMETSDVIITKPGGLTISEAIAKRLPIISPYYIPGQEKENLNFLVKEGLAIYVEENNIKATIETVMDNPEILEAMRKRMEKLSQQFSLDKVFKLGEKLIQDYNYRLGTVYGG
ncbi:glycosyltransferase [Tissierella carlieri]|uniref:Glycosyltransferase n=1 Tax=Tissierella carlieri TaxID=689904 RepID=A0ABT1S999_9FIRM|nr:glycosyltransferase [Tissierella carlieri]MCQ4923050.1 glycosyltransferase [Tissierella carlieri]MDU5081867.1 glycosyltransferase [Bacillota bacterium]